MSTTPASPVVATTTGADLSWFKHHLILLTVVAVLIFGGVYGVLTIIDRHDAQRAAESVAAAAAADKQNAVVQAATQQQIALLAAQNQQLQAAIVELTKAYA